MKKLLWLLVIILMLGVVGVAAHAEEQQRSLTLMVYMCGSNLESAYGSASADIQEMLESGFQDSRISVLVMAGGAKTRNRWFDAGNTAIYEIGAGKSRKVWNADRMSMGNRETLTQLLRFGADRYPAEKYALILWDHGGGPMEGVCWDELFSMDNLSLYDLTEGLRLADYPEKLSWIGFDACLMCTAEVAKAVAPYAEYMIGSQETEPASGWNYAFLKGLEQDRNGAETGQRVVDSYFDSLQDSRDLLTMACVDLGKIDALLESMDVFFNPLGSTISDKTFSDVSGVRKASTGFGQAVRAVGEDGYDLVDLGDLISRFGKEDGELRQALQDTVVVSRSNREGAGGLSVYHPFVNKRKYLESWRDDYRALEFSDGYARYLERFGAMLTGEELVDWSNLSTLDLGTDAEGNHVFSLQLSEEQREEMASVQLMIIEKVSDYGSGSFAPISVETAGMDANGQVSAKYRGRALYVLDENGNTLTGPISFQLSEDGEYYIVLTTYNDYSTRTVKKETATVLHYCRLNPETNDLEIERSYVYDLASQSYTNRIGYSEDGYTDLNFRLFVRNLPDPEGAMDGFYDWERFNGYYERTIELPAHWHLHFTEDWESTNLYAMFQVTDVRQNTWSSVPVAIGNPNEAAVMVSPSLIEKDKVALRVSAVQKNTKQDPALVLNFDLENRAEEVRDYRGTEFVLNGNRMASKYLWRSSVKPGESESYTISLQAEDLTGLTEVETVDFDLEISGSDYNAEKETLHVHLELQGADVSAFVPIPPASLSEVQTENALWRLVSLEQMADGSFSGILCVRNDSDTELNTEAALMMNGVRAEGTVALKLAPHQERYFPFTAENGVRVNRFNLHVADSRRLYHLGVSQALEQAGVRAVEQVELWLGLDDSLGLDGEKISLALQTPLPLQEAEKALAQIPLLEGDVSVSVESVLIADDGVALGLRLRNTSDESVFLQMVRPEMNGTAFDGFEPLSAIVLPAHSAAVRCLMLRVDKAFQPGDSVNELQFTFRNGNVLSEPAKLVFPEGSVLGAPGGTLLEAAEMAEVLPAVLTEKQMALSETVVIPETEIRPILASAPITAEEAASVDRGNVNLCLLGKETATNSEGKPEEMYVTRIITATPIVPDKTGGWSITLSGLAVMVNDRVLSSIELQQEWGQTWRVRADDLFLYSEAENFHPAKDNDLLSDGRFSWYSDLYFTVENHDGKISFTVEKLALHAWNNFYENRSNCGLNEVALTAIETRVFFGTNRMVNMDTLDYNEMIPLSMDQPLTVSLVPVESLQEPLCLYYVLYYLDGSRDDLIVDLKTGEILERSHWPGE